MSRLRDLESKQPRGSGTAAVDAARFAEQSKLRFAIEKRSDVVLCQAVSTLVTAFSRKLRLVQRYMSPEAGRRLLLQYSRVGFLLSCESLLSTAGSEFGMLGDYEKGVRMLSRFSFRLLPPTVPKQESRAASRASSTATSVPSSAHGHASALHRNMSTMSGWAPRYNTYDWAAGGGVEILRQSDSSYVIEIRMWPVDDVDDGAGADSDAGAGAGAGAGAESPEASDAAVYGPKLLALVPSELLNGRLIRVFPVIFTQGINERQTLANMNFLQRAPLLQNEINHESLRDLFTYYTLYKKHYQAQTAAMEAKLESLPRSGRRARATSSSASAEPAVLDAHMLAHQELSRQRYKLLHLEDLLRQIEHTISTSNRKKDVSILRLTNKFVREVHGARVTSCKSAKDRTAMSVTWEQGQLLEENHGLRCVVCVVVCLCLCLCLSLCLCLCLCLCLRLRLRLSVSVILSLSLCLCHSVSVILSLCLCLCLCACFFAACVSVCSRVHVPRGVWGVQQRGTRRGV